MRRSRAELEAALEAEAKQAIREYLDWAESTARPTLTEIEDAVLKLRKRLGERMAQAVIDAQDTVRPLPGPASSRVPAPGTARMGSCSAAGVMMRFAEARRCRRRLTRWCTSCMSLRRRRLRLWNEASHDRKDKTLKR
jgi:hypothetical protein